MGKQYFRIQVRGQMCGEHFETFSDIPGKVYWTEHEHDDCAVDLQDLVQEFPKAEFRVVLRSSPVIQCFGEVRDF